MICNFWDSFYIINTASNPSGGDTFWTTPCAASVSAAGHAFLLAVDVASVAFHLTSATAFVAVDTAGTIAFAAIFIAVLAAAVTPVAFPVAVT